MCIFLSGKSDSRYLNISNWTIQYRPQNNNKKYFKKKGKLPQLPGSQCWISPRYIVNTSYHTERVCRARPTLPEQYLHCNKSCSGIIPGLSDTEDKDLCCVQQPSHAERGENQRMDGTRKETNLGKCCLQEWETHFLFVITAKQSFQERSENGQAWLRLKWGRRQKAERCFSQSLSTGKPALGSTWPWGR